MKLDLSDEQMQTLLSKTILDALTPERRDQLFQEALKNLLSESEYPNNHYDKSTKLQAAFGNAARKVSEKVIGEMLSEPEYQTKFRELIHDAFAKIFEPGGKRDEIIHNMSGVFIKSLESSR